MPSADEELAKQIVAKISDKKILSEQGLFKLLELLTKPGTNSTDWSILAQNEIKSSEQTANDENK